MIPAYDTGDWHYKGYSADIRYSKDDAIYFGKIAFITDLVTFEAESLPLLSQEFKRAVDGYLAFCKDLGQEPEIPGVIQLT